MCKSVLTVLFISTLVFAAGSANATFSIVAVDPVTGAAGGAGASCIANSYIINDVIEGIGAVHTQAYWLQANWDNAHARLAEGLTPDSIIAWLDANDAQGRSSLRQYGVVTLAGPGASAGFTGSGTDSWAEHRTGFGYSIQGNILLGPEIIDTMEFAFLNTPGPLEEKLMAALEAAKVPGADTRCFAYGKSSISAFIKVVHPGDGGTPFLQEIVANTAGSTDPIGVLRQQYDAWKLEQQADPDSSTIASDRAVMEVSAGGTAQLTMTPQNYLGQPPTADQTTSLSNTGTGNMSSVVDNGDGSFGATLTAGNLAQKDSIYATFQTGGIQVQTTTPAVVTYYICGDMNYTNVDPNIEDLTFMVDYLFGGGAAPPIIESSDIDGSGGDPNITDLTAFVDYLFAGGAPPVCEP